MWTETAVLNSSNQNIYCRYNIQSSNKANIIYIQTPLVSVSGMLQTVYEPLAAYGYNVFAIDLTGVGKSDGDISEFSLKSLVTDIDCVIDYITSKNHLPVFLYASTGIGGICGQYYVSRSERVKAFAQFGVGLYQDLSPMKIPTPIAKIAFKPIKAFSALLPHLSIKMALPKYQGKNKALDDSFYINIIKEYPRFCYANIKWSSTFFEMFLSPKSDLQKLPQCPTLVFKTLHDRYFTPAYFDNYFNRLTCQKKLYIIDDVHNSYFFRADEVCSHVAEWFSQCLVGE